MAGERGSDDGPPVYDYEAAVVGMLSLRLGTPVGEWLSDADLEHFSDYQREAIEADGDETANENLLLLMMNAAWLAIQYLAEATHDQESVWLQRIALDLRSPGGS